MPRRRKSESVFLGKDVGVDLLIEAAYQLFDESGPTAITARNIARRVGCSPAVLYNKVPGMLDIRQQVARLVLKRLVFEMHDLRWRCDGEGLVVAQARRYRAFWRRDKRPFGFVFHRPPGAWSALGRVDLGWIWPDLLRAFPTQEEARSWWARLHGIVALEDVRSLTEQEADALWERAIGELEVALRAAAYADRSGSPRTGTAA